MLKIGVLVLLALICLDMGQTDSSSQCQVCQEDNQIFCESESTYFICLGNRQVGPYYCGVDEVCSNSEDICVKKDALTADVKNVCGGGEGCQSCSANQIYTCVSRTQAARCINGDVSPSLIINCDADEVCITGVEAFKNVCVPDCVANFAKKNATCSNLDYTPPTQSPPTTPSPAVEQSICQEAAAKKTTRYFFAYADSTCRTYVYCERSTTTSTVFTTTFSGGCNSPNPYFNTVSGSCQATTPDSCRTDAPTTTQAPTTQTPTTLTPPTSSSSVPESSQSPSPTSSEATDEPTASSSTAPESSQSPSPTSSEATDEPTASSPNAPESTQSPSPTSSEATDEPTASSPNAPESTQSPSPTSSTTE
ncbi:hypothetical protein KR044_005598 [Drosophila immigrans]|nr:hypothetical protein KR044_005598 [Drosophila immigrans]